MTEAERDAIDKLKARLAWLEQRLAELDPPRPIDPATYVKTAYPKRADEV